MSRRDMASLLPQNAEAEMGVLSAMLQGGVEVIEEMDAALKPECFQTPAHLTIFGFIVGLVREKKPADLISLTNILRDRGALEEVGGAGYVTELYSFLPTAANIGHHAAIVREMHSRRRLLAVAEEIKRSVYAATDDSESETVLDKAQQDILLIAEQNDTEETFRKPKEGVLAAVEALEAAYANRGGIQGISTGLIDLDRMLGGFKPKQNIVIGGSTGMGKTALMLNMAKAAAVGAGIPVAFLSLEMGYEELMARALHEEAGVSLQRARDGFLSEADFPKLIHAANKLADAPIYVDETAAVNVFELKAKCRRAVKKFGAKIIFVDYLQLLESSEERKDENRQMELTRISRACKLIAKGFGITMVLGAQLNREPDKRTEHLVINPNVKDEETGRPMKFKRKGVPMLSDMRESGAIANDADVVMCPYRPWYWSHADEDKASEKREWASIFVLKQRNGPVGQVLCQYIPDETRFVSLTDQLYSNDQSKHQTIPEE